MLCGAAAGIIQTCLNVPQLALVVYIPIFYSLFRSGKIFGGRFGRLKSWHIFVFAAQLVSCSFLVTVYRLMPLPAVVGIVISAAVTVALALWLTFLTTLPIAFIGKVRTGQPWDILSFCALYIVGEWLCENIFFLSFPWSAVSLSVTSWSEFVQSASLMGGKFTSLIILCINGSTAYAVFKKLPSRRSAACVCSAVILTAVCVFYGANHILYVKNLAAEDGKAVNVLIAQDSIEGKEKAGLKGTDAAEHYLSILTSGWADNTDLILLPETAVPENFDENSEEFKGLTALAKSKNATICSGAFCQQGKLTYNAVYAITPDGAEKTPYLKQVLVPFGEQIPFADFFHAATISCCEEEKYIQPLDTEEYRIGCGICIESIYPSLFRSQAEKGGEFFIIPINDSWFGKSFARYAHYRHSIMRAVENSRYTLRSGNCGISAIISPWGEELASMTDHSKGVISGRIKTQHQESIYTRTGDRLLLSLCLLYLTCRFYVVTTRAEVS